MSSHFPKVDSTDGLFEKHRDMILVTEAAEKAFRSLGSGVRRPGLSTDSATY